MSVFHPPAVPFPPSCCPLFLTSISHLVYCTALLIVFDVERSTLVVSHHDSENEQEFDLASWTCRGLVTEIFYFLTATSIGVSSSRSTISGQQCDLLTGLLTIPFFPKLALQHGADDSLDSSLVHVAGAPYAGDNDEFRPMVTDGHELKRLLGAVRLGFQGRDGGRYSRGSVRCMGGARQHSQLPRSFTST
ncbi:hypothetical protein EV421DRAFT_1743438 [Armillaria borealis]|uniref:Uncharacterized protein n=1 Tax=Armillaria borealis TaxID=47425 RepID=A0AA39IV76_9AGAR|nr:hypothetical protein EV421DRAFT_1743438 [Armillaria borealis]